MRRMSTSPTISSTLGRSRSMVAQMVSPSVWPRSSSTMVPPTANAVLAWCTAVACTSGVVSSDTSGVPRSRQRFTSAISWSTESGGASPCSAEAAMSPYPSRVPWCQSTPLGRPVVPPVYQRRRSSPERSIRGAGAWERSSSS